MRKLLLSSVMLLGLVGVASAHPCNGRFTATAWAHESSDSKMMVGSLLEDITQMEIYHENNTAFYCQHGGYCYPVLAVKLLNCHVGKQIPPSASDDGDLYFEMKDR